MIKKLLIVLLLLVLGFVAWVLYNSEEINLKKK